MALTHRVIIGTALVLASCASPQAALPQHQKQQGTSVSSAPSSAGPTAIAFPINNALSRVTKKPFGLFVDPQHSPVSPERFTGYHTGADFETAPKEQTLDVPIFALCEGTVIAVLHVSGYGGVLMQTCTLSGERVTVLYGHLRLQSVTVQAGQQVHPGDRLALLGTGYSPETNGERKHLHLGIHKGARVDERGYVQTKAELTQWIDPMQLMH